MQELLETANEVILENGFSEIERRLGEMRTLLKEMPLTEGFTDNHRGDLDKKFDEIENKLLTARRMLGKVNASKFSPEEQAMHKSKIMRYINVFRKQLYDVMIEMGMSGKEMQYHLDRIDLDREHGKPAETFTRTSPPEKRQFSDMVNAKRNVAAPEDVGGFKQPGSKGGENQKKWYQRIFR